MKSKSIVAPVLLILFLSFFGAAGYIAYKPIWQYDHLEQNARKVITGPELQAWATNVLAQYPTNDGPMESVLGTNFPQQLRGLDPKHGPGIVIYDGYTKDGNTNSPRWISVHWGSGFLGHCGFEIGPTNFHGAGHEWQPGVYFYKRP
jgi:hypothetical protein